jgi:uncharacterized protein YndB with AHSA1/START domain
MATHTDAIEKRIFLKASRARVWRALSDSEEFGAWFGVRFSAPFSEGATLTGTLVGTRVDPEIAKSQRQYADVPFSLVIERMEPERRLSFRWHPHAVEKGVDYSSEPTTQVVFTLEEGDRGVWLTVRESGFDAVPLARRAKAFAANAEGWAIVLTLVEKHLASSRE